jgi:hypothetical protein
VQAVYARYHPNWRDCDPRNEPDTCEKIRELAGYIDSTHRFTPVTVRTYPWQQTYTTAEYLALLNTRITAQWRPAGARGYSRALPT